MKDIILSCTHIWLLLLVMPRDDTAGKDQHNVMRSDDTAGKD